MIRIEVKTSEVQTRTGNARATGNPYSIRTQEAWAYTYAPNGNLHPYPEKISLQLDDGQAPFSPGNYQISPSSIYVGDFGRLNLGRPVLVPYKTQAAA